MATLIVLSCLAVTLIFNGAGWLLNRRAQAWRRSPA
jgi:hypothetical protein